MKYNKYNKFLYLTAELDFDNLMNKVMYDNYL